MASPLASWDATKRKKYAGSRWRPTIHLLLDASGSMGMWASEVTRSYRTYLAHLQQVAPPGTFLDQRCFTGSVGPGKLELLSEAKPMSYEVGGGTRLYEAISAVIGQDGNGLREGDHLLVILTDGYSDTEQGRLPAKLAAFWPTPAGERWLPVFLGAFPQAMEVGLGMGIAEGNCLCFSSAEWPEAFTRLQAGTDRYLTAPTVQERRLLTTGGVFA